MSIRNCNDGRIDKETWIIHFCKRRCNKSSPLYSTIVCFVIGVFVVVVSQDTDGDTDKKDIAVSLIFITFIKNLQFSVIIHFVYSVILLYKLTVLELVKKFTIFYWTRRFNTAFTKGHHLLLIWSKLSQSTPSHSHSLRSIYYYHSTYACGFHVISLLQVPPPKSCIHFSLPPFVFFIRH